MFSAIQRVLSRHTHNKLDQALSSSVPSSPEPLAIPEVDLTKSNPSSLTRKLTNEELIPKYTVADAERKVKVILADYRFIVDIQLEIDDEISLLEDDRQKVNDLVKRRLQGRQGYNSPKDLLDIQDQLIGKFRAYRQVFDKAKQLAKFADYAFEFLKIFAEQYAKTNINAELNKNQIPYFCKYYILKSGTNAQKIALARVIMLGQTLAAEHNADTVKLQQFSNQLNWLEDKVEEQHQELLQPFRDEISRCQRVRAITFEPGI